jgi:hypothetical protein
MGGWGVWWVREGLMRFVKTWTHQHWPGNSPFQDRYFLTKNYLNLKMNNEYQEIRSESWNMKNKTQQKFTQLHHSCSLKNTCSRIFFHGFDFDFGTCVIIILFLKFRFFFVIFILKISETKKIYMSINTKNLKTWDNSVGFIWGLLFSF